MTAPDNALPIARAEVRICLSMVAWQALIRLRFHAHRIDHCSIYGVDAIRHIHSTICHRRLDSPLQREDSWSLATQYGTMSDIYDDVALVNRGQCSSSGMAEKSAN